MRGDRVVPLAMKRCRRQLDVGKLFSRHVLLERIRMVIQLGTDLQTGRRPSVADQLNDHGVAGQRSGPPVLRDVTKHAVLDLVPFARARRKMTNRQPQAQIVRQVLQGDFPQSRSAAITPAAICSDQQVVGLRIPFPAHLPPPSRDARRRKSRRIVIDADTHPPLIAGQIVHAVWNRLGRVRIPEVMHADFVRPASRPPLSPRILEITYPFLLLRIDRDRRLAPPLSPAGGYRRIAHYSPGGTVPPASSGSTAN
jgi:hypothetical protein